MMIGGLKKSAIGTLAFFMTAGASLAREKPEIRKPELPGAGKKNVLVIVADDLACNELGCYGGTNIKTPNIDKLAREGIQFNQMYASEAICSPTRASIYTGLYPVRNGVYRNHGNTRSTVKSVTSYLGDMGYRVGITGKTDVRPKSVYPFEIIDGFETNCVSPNTAYTTDGIRQFMSGKTGRPFCLFVCSTNPHVPWTGGDPSKIDPDKLKLPPVLIDNHETRLAFTKYLAEVGALDWQVGDVIAALKESGKYNETMIIFCGEQGPQFPGGKWTCWDYGQKSAFIVKLPGAGSSPRKTEALVQYEDLLPTLIDYLGGSVPEGLDGKSFLPVLDGKTDTSREWAYGIHNNVPEGTPYPIRSIRNSRYKLIVNLDPKLIYYEKHLMGLDKENYWYSWVRDAKAGADSKGLVLRYIIRPEFEFYDIQNDPWEMQNLAEGPKYQTVIEQMKEKLFQWMDQQGDPGKALDETSGH